MFMPPPLFWSLGFISILVIFDEAFNVSSLLNIFKRKEKEETEKEVKILDGNEPAKGYQEKPIQVSPLKNIIQPDGARISEFIKTTLLRLTPPPLSILERDRGKPEVGDIKANSNIIKELCKILALLLRWMKYLLVHLSPDMR